jgi:hypothetical protein
MGEQQDREREEHDRRNQQQKQDAERLQREGVSKRPPASKEDEGQ